MTEIEVKNLCFTYDKVEVLKNLSFSIKQNTTTILLGLNGSGKSTLIKLLTGLLSAKIGAIYIRGKDIKEYSTIELSKMVAYVPQTITNDNDFYVEEYVTFGMMNTLKFYKSPSKEDYEKTKMLLIKMGIQNLSRKRMNELSGGQRQLVVIARAIVQDSQIIILDEPTSSLDYKNQELVLKTLGDLQNKGKTIIFSCHNPSIAMLLNSEILVLDSGQLKAQGNARSLLTPEFLKQLYGCELVSCKDLPYEDVSLNPR